MDLIPTGQPQRDQNMAWVVGELLKELGENPAREGLRDTPRRVARSLRELTNGYRLDPRKVIGEAIYSSESQGQVVIRDIRLFSLCEHHLLPFIGKVQVAYRPRGKIIGLSKVPRVVDIFARRLQLQERLTAQVADALEEVLKPAALAVVSEAYHLCMSMRGARQAEASTRVSELRGDYKTNAELRDELFRSLATPTQTSSVPSGTFSDN